MQKLSIRFAHLKWSKNSVGNSQHFTSSTNAVLVMLHKWHKGVNVLVKADIR